jgi:hypothetical protein
MSEAYDLADRGDHEGYNAIKVMCGDVLELIGKQWVGLTEEDYKELSKIAFVEVIEKIERVLKEKNT